MAPPSRDWTDAENEATVADYFVMLAKELRGEPLNKAEHLRRLRPLLNDRDRAIEFKRRNISAVLASVGWPYIQGYKPLPNYQASLADVVLDHLESDAAVRSLALDFASASVGPTRIPNILDAMTDPPSDLLEAAKIALAARKQRRARTIDYLAREAENSQVGAGGETFVVSYERARLSSLGHGVLAERVEHVARTRGNGLGYDVLSFEPNGRERFIEVKTTKLGPLTPFYLSSNERSFSIENRTQFSLYRVYDFVATPSMFSLDGSVEETCALTPAQYMAVPRG